jgi:tripeptide aminopeptidase
VADHRKLNPSEDGLPKLDVDVRQDFTELHVPEEHPVVALAEQAASNLGRSMTTKTSGGGSDANIFFGHGIVTGILGTGMKDMHTVRESIQLDDMVRCVELLVEIVKVHAAGS